MYRLLSLFLLICVSPLQGATLYPFVIHSRDPVVFQVELADTPTKRRQGLMYRDALPADQGMLFLYSKESYRCFWMKNTKIPLDIVFFNKNMKVVGIIRNTTPFSTKRLCIDKKSQYILEINAGLSDAYGIDVGTQAQLNP